MNTKNEEKWKKAIFWIFDAPKLKEKPLEVILIFLLKINYFFLGKD